MQRRASYVASYMIIKKEMIYLLLVTCDVCDYDFFIGIKPEVSVRPPLCATTATLGVVKGK